MAARAESGFEGAAGGGRRRQWQVNSKPTSALKIVRASPDETDENDSKFVPKSGRNDISKFEGIKQNETEEANPWSAAADANDALEALAQAKMEARRLALRKAEKKASPSEATSKLLRIAKGVLYAGEVQSGRPHGRGDLILENGAVHSGLFSDGRAHGEGTLYEASGAIIKGSWVMNKRVGSFSILDGKGREWDESYNDEGKRTSRKRVGDASTDQPAATKCDNCGVMFHASHDIGRCRQHKGQWKAITDPPDLIDWKTFPEGGMWLCCGEKKTIGGMGCVLGSHRTVEPEPVPRAVPRRRAADAVSRCGDDLAAMGIEQPPAMSELDQLHALGDKKFGRRR